MTYEYDVFLSYTRSGGAGEWVRNHFFDTLHDCLNNAMPREPRIFVDWAQETGIVWPDNLAHSLNRSRVMVAILSPPYFRSTWCLAEWSTMWQRQRSLGLGTGANPRSLIHCVQYADGDHYSEEARTLTLHDFRPWNIPRAVFAESVAYVNFFTEVRRFAESLAPQLERVPPHQEGWPILRPSAPRHIAASLPRL